MPIAKPGRVRVVTSQGLAAAWGLFD